VHGCSKLVKGLIIIIRRWRRCFGDVSAGFQWHATSSAVAFTFTWGTSTTTRNTYPVELVRRRTTKKKRTELC
jgi:hypothetical protein